MNIKILLLLVFLPSLIFAQERDPRNMRNLPAGGRSDNSMWAKPVLLKQGSGGSKRPTSEEEKKEIETFFKSGGKNCRWELNHPRKVALTGCETDSAVCVGDMECDWKGAHVGFPMVHCASKFCGQPAECLRDHSVDTVILDMNGKPLMFNQTPERGKQ